MNFLIAPNALKGSLSAPNAASIISRAIQDILHDARCVLCPISDGGNGTLECLVQATGGKFYSVSVCGPLASMTVNARWGVLGDGTTAVIEMAEAAGLHLLKPSQYDAAHATTFGVGELIRKAMNSGCKKIIVGMGGSATNDGGAGCARAVGIKFFDGSNIELPDGGIHLSQLHHIIMKNEELRIKETEIVGLSDVTNILCGPEGASFTFGAQKGATAEQMRMLDEALKHYASIIETDVHRNVSHLPGSGAAGDSARDCSHFAMPKYFPGSISCSMCSVSTICCNNVIALLPPKERWTHRPCTAKESKASCGTQRNSTNLSTHSPERFSVRKPLFGKDLGLQHFTRYRPTTCRLMRQCKR